MDWFLYDIGLRHEKVNGQFQRLQINVNSKVINWGINVNILSNKTRNNFYIWYINWYNRYIIVSILVPRTWIRRIHPLVVIGNNILYVISW